LLLPALLGLWSLGANAEPDLAPADEPALTPAQRLLLGKAAFDGGDCVGTSTALAPLAVPGSLADARDQQSVHWMLGVCFALAQRTTEAAREFSSLLVLDPDYAIDPLLTPPVAVELFERQRSQMKAQLEEIRRARDEAKRVQSDATRGVLVERQVTVREVPLAAVFLPLGLAQVANADLGWAILFGATQGVFLATNITAYWINIGFKAIDPETGASLPTGEEWVGHQIAWYVHVGALGAFVLAYGLSVAQAWWAREEQEVVDRQQVKRQLTPEELRRLRDVRTAPDDRSEPVR
jgi:hypothetical protein